MKNKAAIFDIFRKPYAIFFVLLIWGMNDARAQAVSTEEDFLKQSEKTVEAATREFYLALNEMFTGNIEPMKRVWSHADDVTYMGPAGNIRTGWQAVLADWEAQAALKLGGAVEPGDFHITVGPRIAVVINEEFGQNTDAEGNIQKVAIRATHIFRKEKGSWKMIGDHADPLPFLPEQD